MGFWGLGVLGFPISGCRVLGFRVDRLAFRAYLQPASCVLHPRLLFECDKSAFRLTFHGSGSVVEDFDRVQAYFQPDTSLLCTFKLMGGGYVRQTIGNKAQKAPIPPGLIQGP